MKLTHGSSENLKMLNCGIRNLPLRRLFEIFSVSKNQIFEKGLSPLHHTKDWHIWCWLTFLLFIPNRRETCFNSTTTKRLPSFGVDQFWEIWATKKIATQCGGVSPKLQGHPKVCQKVVLTSLKLTTSQPHSKHCQRRAKFPYAMTKPAKTPRTRSKHLFF